MNCVQVTQYELALRMAALCPDKQNSSCPLLLEFPGARGNRGHKLKVYGKL